MTISASFSPAKATQTILVVDDDPMTRLICAKKLRQAGFQVFEASDSAEALRISREYKQEAIHLLITDLFLEPPNSQHEAQSQEFLRVQGHELIRHFLKDQGASLATLMSSKREDEMTDLGVEKNRYVFLQKPIKVEELLGLVHELLSGPQIAPLVLR